MHTIFPASFRVVILSAALVWSFLLVNASSIVEPPSAPRLLFQLPSPPLVAGEAFFVRFEHDGLRTSEYRLRIDGSLVTTLPGSASAGGGTVTFLVTAGLAAGSHTVLVDAVGEGGLTTAPALTLPISPPPPQPIPAPRSQEAPQIALGVLTPPVAWMSSVLGLALPAGSWVLSANRHTVTVGGTDIWGLADQGRVVMQPRTGDFDLTARVELLQGSPDPWSKAGVMVRETLAAGSKNVYLAATGAMGWQLQWRATTGGVSASVPGRPAGTAPGWVRLTRRGNVFTAYRSVDGVAWTLFPVTSTTSIAMTPAVFVGVAVTSHQAGTLATAVLTNVTVQ